MGDLSVTVDYTRYHGTSNSHQCYPTFETDLIFSGLSDTLTVSRGRRPCAAFTHKMLWLAPFVIKLFAFWRLFGRLAKAKSHPIYSDCTLNTDYVVHLNIYQNFLLCALKMHCYLRELDIVLKNTRFLRGTFIWKSGDFHLTYDLAS